MTRAGNKRAGRRRFFRRPAGLVVLAAVTCVGAASALAATGMTSRDGAEIATRALAVQAQPASRTVAPGASTSFTVRVSRSSSALMRLSGRTVLRVPKRGLPAGTQTFFAPLRAIASASGAGQPSILTVTTSTSARPGTYQLRVRAQRPQRRGSTVVRLVVSGDEGSVSPAVPSPVPAPPPVEPQLPPPPDAFAIAGVLSVPLTPGMAAPLELMLSNHEDTDISITSLDAAVTAVDAPLADLAHPCGTADFSVEQFSGTLGFTLPAASGASLGELGFAPAEWPQVLMLNRGVNQDGCKGASLTLSYAGSAQGGTP